MAKQFKTQSLILSGTDVNNLFYPISNPSGFITNTGTSLVDKSMTGILINTSMTGSLVNTSMTGILVNTGATGAFVSSGWVDTYYYPRTNPSGFGAGGGLTQQQTMVISSFGL